MLKAERVVALSATEVKLSDGLTFYVEDRDRARRELEEAQR
jgi:hypothetical protein